MSFFGLKTIYYKKFDKDKEEKINKEKSCCFSIFGHLILLWERQTSIHSFCRRR